MNDANTSLLAFFFGGCCTLIIMELCRCNCPKGKATPGPIGIILWLVVETAVDTVRLFEKIFGKIFAWAMRRFPLMTIVLLFVTGFVAICGFSAAMVVILVMYVMYAITLL